MHQTAGAAGANEDKATKAIKLAAAASESPTDNFNADSQRLAAIKTELTQRGCSLFDLADGSFLLTHRTFSQPLPDLQAAARFLRRMGGAV